MPKHDVDRIVRTMIIRDILEEKPQRSASGFVCGYVHVCSGARRTTCAGGQVYADGLDRANAHLPDS